MVWTTFSALTNPTLPELDANFNILSGLTPIPCTIGGSANALALANIASAGSVAAYANYMRLTGVAAANNNGAATAQLGSLPVLNIYKDTPAGPVALAGNEIVQNNEITLIYDLALNSGAGGFHLKTGSSELVGQTVTMGDLVVTGPASLSSLVVGGGSPMTRFASGTLSLGFSILGPQAASAATIIVSGAAVNDAVIVGGPAVVPNLVAHQAHVAATGSVVLSVINTGSVSLTLSNLTYRATAVGNA